ncbi:MAG: POT family MFS transporter [Planctomycetales bacterium]|nr:POT family MFS transporter [Planctomycetales bacterium]
MTPLTTPPQTDGMPSGIPFIVGNEAAERFSFYGMKAILSVFLTGYLLNASGELAPMTSHESNSWIHNFVAAVYLMAFFGAILSDWLLGKYRTIISLSLVYCLGHAVMAFVDYPLLTGIDPRSTLFAGLALIAIGSGGIKPCVSAHVGDQFGVQNKHLIPKVFSWFYFSINLGSMISTLLIPILLEHFGPGVAFGVPGILMGLATFVFWLGRNRFVHIPAGGSRFWRETLSAEGLAALKNLAPLILLLAPFWALFDQTQTSWVQQTKQLDCELFGKTILPSQIQAANPFLVLAFIPLFSYVIYPYIDRIVRLTPLRKIGIGMVLTAPSFVIIALIQASLDQGEMPSVVWQLVAYVVMTAAEVMVSITALEFCYTQAPKKMKSLMSNVLMLSISTGNAFASYVNKHIELKRPGAEHLQGANYFWFFTAVMVVGASAFIVWAQFYRGRTYIQGDDN